MLSRIFESREVNIWKQLYTSMVRPHLEYTIQVWSQILKKDITKLEKIQRRTTRIPNKLKNLEERWKRDDLIYTYTLTKRYESLK